MAKEKYTTTFVLGVLVCAFGGTFQYGFNVANVNGPEQAIKDRLYPVSCAEDLLTNETFTEPLCNVNGTCSCTEEQRNSQISSQKSQFSTAVGIFPIGGMIGSFATSFLVSRFGRKGAQLINMGLSLVGGILYVTSYYLSSAIAMVSARFVIGIFAGLATGICPMYNIEISSQSLRGPVGVLGQLMITIGILTAQILSFPQIMGKPDLWGIFMGLTMVPALIWFLWSPKMVESPRYSLIEKSRDDQARKDLMKLRGTDDIEDELKELEEEALKSQGQETMSILELLKDKTSRWQLIVVSVGQIGQQLSGINAIFFYTNSIFQAAGFSGETSTIISALIGLENVIMTFVSVILIEKVGRTGLTVIGFGIMTIFCCGMTASLLLQHYATWVPYLSIVCVLGYIVGFAIGPGPVPWIWNNEFFRQSARGPAGSISCGLNWTAAFLVGKFFPLMQDLIGPYVFIFFGGVSIFCCLFLYKFAPETKGRSLAQIEAAFAKMNGTKLEEQITLKSEEYQ